MDFNDRAGSNKRAGRNFPKILSKFETLRTEYNCHLSLDKVLRCDEIDQYVLSIDLVPILTVSPFFEINMDFIQSLKDNLDQAKNKFTLTRG